MDDIDRRFLDSNPPPSQTPDSHVARIQTAEEQAIERIPYVTPEIRELESVARLTNGTTGTPSGAPS